MTGMEVTNQTLGVASNSAQLPIGIMGLGPDLERGFAVNESYPVLLDSLVAQKQIASRIYSVDLGVADDAQGKNFLHIFFRIQYANICVIQVR